MSTPYELVRAVAPVEQASKREMIGLSRTLERAALSHPPTAVAASLQDERHLTERTRAVYAALAARGAPAVLHARGLPAWLAPGVSGVALADDDPLVDQWVVVLPGPEGVVLAATDLRVLGCDDERQRCFTYGISRGPHVVASCGRLLGI